LRSFRLDRINRLVSGEAPVQLSGEHLIVLHILPLDAVRREGRLQTEELSQANQEHRLRPINSSDWGPSFNFEGIILKSNDGEGKVESYVQLFRKGFVEIVESKLLEPRQFRHDAPKVKCIPSNYWERKILETFPGYLKALDSIGIPLPYSISLSLLNVRGFQVILPQSHSFYYDSSPINHEHLLTEEVLMESMEQPVDKLLRPLFDQVWNACGRAGSLSYDQDGRWRDIQ
jgi:hypothetical protein